MIFDETEGNPFFVEEVFQHLVDEGTLFDASGAWRAELKVETLQVPDGVRLIIGRRLDRLSEPTRRVLTTAALIGRLFSSAILEALEAASPIRALDALEEAERAHLIVAESTGREPRYRFAHELIRQTLADGCRCCGGSVSTSASATRSSASTRRRSRSMRRRSRITSIRLAPQRTSKDVHDLLLAAEQARAAAAHEESLARLDDALSLLEGETDISSPTFMRGVRPRYEALVRRRGRSSYERAIALFDQAGDIEKMAATSVELGWVHSWNADRDAALRVARRALERLGDAIPVTSAGWCSCRP